MSMITVRRATVADLGSAAALFDQYRVFYHQASDLPAARHFLSERIGNEESVVLLAFDDDQPAGFVQLYPSFSSVGMKRIWILNDLFVDAAYRQKGIARRLMEDVLRFAKSRGYGKVILSTAPDNLQAQRLYESTGFRQSKFLEYEIAVK